MHRCLPWEFRPLSLTCPGQESRGFPLSKEPSNLISCLSIPVSPPLEGSICHREVRRRNLWVKAQCAAQSGAELGGDGGDGGDTSWDWPSPAAPPAAEGLAAIRPRTQVPANSVPSTWPLCPPFSLRYVWAGCPQQGLTSIRWIPHTSEINPRRAC